MVMKDLFYDDFKITGTLIKNYFHCKREAFLYYYGINFRSDLVRIGELFHEEAGSKELIFEKIKVDDIKDDTIIEFKKTSSNFEGTKFQVLYYLYYFKTKGVFLKGKIIDLTFKKEYEVILDENNESLLKNNLNDLKNMLKNNSIPIRKEKKSLCKGCSFFDFCWVD